MKEHIHLFLVSELSKKINALQAQINDMQTAVNQEAKSSAGDKHETARAMAQLEVEQCAKQLQENERQLQQLQKIPHHDQHHTVGVGSFIESESALFYVALGFGKRIVEGKEVFCIGVQSPIFNELKGKRVGDSFVFMQQQHRIEKVY